MSFYTFLPKILNMSLTASVAIVFVLLLRLLLKKAPKVISYALWGVVLIRLLCPVAFESPFSLINTPDTARQIEASAETYIEPTLTYTDNGGFTPDYDVLLNRGYTPNAQGEIVTNEAGTREAFQVKDLVRFAGWIWLTGVVAMAIYSAVSYASLRRRLMVASPLRDNIYLADDIDSPFVMGLIRPKIYLPSAMEEREQSYIILHEQHHIRRLDHIVKALAFVALCVHWFNPLVWVAFILSGKDMEMSCDEAVVRKLGTEIRADYSASLLSLATGKRIIAGMPLAFGEGNTKGRIKNLANWKKPAFWVVLVAVMACVVLAVCLLTNPAEKEPDLSFLNYENAISIVADVDEVKAIYCPPSDDESGAAIQVGAATGSDLAKQLDRWDWKKCSAPRQSLPSPGSVEFIIEEDYRITVHQRKAGSRRQYAVVKYQDDIRYYSIDKSDYPDAVALVHAPPKTDIAGKTYLYENEGIMGDFTITLYEDGTFFYYEGMASSYFGAGSFIMDGDILTMTDDGHGGYGLVNRFRRDGDDLVFIEQESDNFVYVKVKDGERFHCTGEAFKQNNESSGISHITDPTDDPNFGYDTAEEKIYTDENNEYFLGGLYGQHIIVHYTDGTQEDIVTALNAGRATITDLDKFGIRYWAEPKVNTDIRQLTAAHIEQINETFSPIVFDRQGNPIGVNTWSCFFTSYYDDVREMNFEEFLAYFPEDGSTVDEEEFAALKELENFLFYGEVSKLSDMPVPVHRYPRRIVDLVLGEYAGISTADLDTSGVEYLTDYDAFYNYTSDAGHGMFHCTRGEVEGDIVRLYEEFDYGTDMLTLRKVGNSYRIVAHQNISES